MTAGSDEFEQLLQQAHAGDRQAMQRLVEQYEPEVRMVARVRLGKLLRPYLDSMDLVQSVHRSLMVGLRNEKFDISSPEKLVGLAITILRRKIARHWRKLQRQNRFGGSAKLDDEFVDLIAGLVSPESDPKQQAELTDQLDELYARLDETERQLIQMRFEGHSTAEVARIIDVDPDVLRVKLSRLRRRIKDIGLLVDWI